jgi:hypothetical protein
MEYFKTTGCFVSLDKSWQCLTVQAPFSQDKWSIYLEMKFDLFRLVPYRTIYGSKSYRKKQLTVDVADPESLSKMLAHIKAKSKFLKGGTNHPRFIPEDV